MDYNFNFKENFKKLKGLIKLVYDHLGDPYYQGAPSAIAYFLFLSILPLVILASQALALVPALDQALPPQAPPAPPHPLPAPAHKSSPPDSDTAALSEAYPKSLCLRLKESCLSLLLLLISFSGHFVCTLS